MTAFGGWSMPVVDFPLFDPELGVTVVAFELGPVDEVLERLSRLEPVPADLERAVPKRRAKYLAGRAAATMALSLAGCPERRTVGRSSDGSPAWPGGFVGSITHGGGIAAAAVARETTCRGLGVDAELVMTPAGAEDVEHLIVSPGELDVAAQALSGFARSAVVTLVFSAKECL